MDFIQIKYKGEIKMNREHSYRAWDKENNEMVLIDFLGEDIIHIKNAEWENKEDFEIMQYTGLKDKNNNKIYEGDIVQAVWYNYEQPECETFGEVIFNSGWLSFCIWNESNKTMSEMNGQGYYTWEIEVVGNIHKNPELINNNLKED
jgi:uncharacterized phage protein (TIGR01671 family)